MIIGIADKSTACTNCEEWQASTRLELDNGRDCLYLCTSCLDALRVLLEHWEGFGDLEQAPIVGWKANGEPVVEEPAPVQKELAL